MKRNLLFLFLLVNANLVFSQNPSWGGRGGQRGNMNAGRFYGKVIDSISGKPVEFAAVQLWGNKWDSVSKSAKKAMLAGELTKSNGDFSLEGLPVIGDFTLKISALGYQPQEQKISFGIDMKKMMGQMKGDGNPNAMASALNAIDKDLGNIKLKINISQLSAVTVVHEKPEFEIKLDKKVFNVEKNITSTGGTAEDVLKNVPSVSVDMDGNVSLRNSSPQLFVDGKPTTLSLDQIPSEAIESVEVITNPSAKYEASGGQAGIINIVLKKSRRFGYNGNMRAGVDSRGRMNGGADISTREGKFNAFASAFLNQRKSFSINSTDRLTLGQNPNTYMFQESNARTNGFFGYGRAGLDYFLDNRNTFTLSGSYNRGNFNTTDTQDNRTDTLAVPATSSFYERITDSKREFQNMGGALLYKHLFPKAGEELTADVYYNKMSSTGGGVYETQYLSSDESPLGPKLLQKQESENANEFITFQTDYVNPLSEKMKIETGFRGNVKNFDSRIDNFFFSPSSNDYLPLPGQNSNYFFSDQVYGAYGTFSHQVKKISYQLGLRVESSFYDGELKNTGQHFSNSYPASFFPSAFLTYQLNEKNDLQFSYSRRIDRPSFFNMIPFTDYTDSLNLSRGNPGLKPEFTHSTEVSYLKTFSRGNNIMVSAYYKNTTDLITRIQILEYDSIFNKNVIMNTYDNADESYAYGLELTSKNSFRSWLEVMFSINAYNSYINASNVNNSLINEQFTWFAELNTTFKLPKNLSFQVSSEYRSKTALSSGGGGGGGGRGGGRWGGGGMWHGGSSSTAQGYVKPKYEIDLALKWDFLKNKAASLTLNARDILRSDKHQTYSESDYFIQNTSRLRDPQIVRLNFSYRFGKFDTSLFKRKNNNMNMEGMDMGGG